MLYTSSAHKWLTRCGLAMPYGDTDLVAIGPANGLLPDGTKPLPEPVSPLIIGEVLWHLTLGNFARNAQDIYVDISLKITNVKIIAAYLRGQWVNTAMEDSRSL